MSEELQRPPVSGPGSGVAAWRAYAAARTDSPAESWAALSREEIIERLDAEDVTAPTAAEADEIAEADGFDGADGRDEETDTTRDEGQADDADTTAAAPRRSSGRRLWMVPTEDGSVAEHELRGR